ncbi:MAG TPA: iron ABC transporter permease [Ramlibacter sp.]|uniref:ABC transporter permease n=1 Tax=Ramlibacter sp. TaxID=1917967 RepID=UPI002D7E71A0|nr:iron ABC transporter permease [Ramlibacter sp.]HET8748218.1 iron ABC transporter permease [Ramlibacter sp.]
MSVALPDAPVALARPQFRLDLLRPAFYVLAAVLVVLVVLPLGWLGYYSIVDKDGQFTLANFATLVTDNTLRKPFGVAIAMALAVGALSCAVAAPLAWLVARTDLPGRRLVRALVMASFVTPPFLGAIAWEILAAPNSGLLNVAWRALTGAQPYDALVDIYSFEGLVFAIACYTFPYVFTLVANGLDRVPSDLEDASSILGARGWTTLRTITLPLVLPAMLAGSLIAVLQALTMFGSPAILALPAGFHVITTKIWSLFQYPPKPGLAAAASLPLLLITVLLLQGKAWVLGRKGYTVLGGKSGEPRVTRLRGWMPLALAFAFVVLSLTVLLPYAALARTALTKNGVAGLTLHNFHFVFFEFSATRLAMWNTMLLGFSTSTIGTGLALLAAYMVSRNPVRGAPWLGMLATAPVAIPGIVLGVGLFLTYSHPQLMLYGTLWILLIAFLTIEMPAGYQQMAAAFHGIHPELEDASRILGASRLKTLRLITAPLLRTSVIATWCFVFIGTIRELSATILLTTANTKLVSVIIYDLNESGDMGAISVLGILLLVVSFAVVLLATRLPLLGGPRLPALR